MQKREDIRRMTEFLLRGATLTDLACPACSSPLFKLKNGDLWCAKCDKKVVVVKEDVKEADITGIPLLEEVEQTILLKLREVTSKIRTEEDLEKLGRLLGLLTGLLESLERVRRSKKS